MTRLSVNINKVALLRNARGGNLPDLLHFAIRCEQYGADGITVHPRPDERHIRRSDVYALKPLLRTEFNIEGFPSTSFIQMVLEVKPHQVTLVPDPPEALTSDHGWEVTKHQSFLQPIIQEFQANGIRVSIFIDPDPAQAEAAAGIGANRVELYTGPYAHAYRKNRDEAIKPYIETAKVATDAGLGINAGHDLNLENLAFLIRSIPSIAEVSIGHALISDALYYGLKKTIKLYKSCLK